MYRHRSSVSKSGPSKSASRKAEKAAGWRSKWNCFEQLEVRAMLSGSPWQNTANVLDVMGGDGPATPLDALAIINDLNKNGSHSLTFLASDSANNASQSATPQGSSSQSSAPPFEDVLGNGTVTPLDALKIIDALGGSDQIQVMLVATNANGVPLASVPVGTTFEIEALVSDISGNATPYIGTTPATGGVFEAEIDASYNSALASIDPNATVTYGSNYVNGQVSDLSTAGQIVGTGAFAGLSDLGPGAIELWSIPVTATATGVETFTPSAGTGPGNEFANYNSSENPIPSSQVDFVPTSVTIVAATAPLITIAPVSIARPTTGTVNEVFTVSLANGSNTAATTVAYATQNGAPVPGVGYENGNGAGRHRLHGHQRHADVPNRHDNREYYRAGDRQSGVQPQSDLHGEPEQPDERFGRHGGCRWHDHQHQCRADTGR